MKEVGRAKSNGVGGANITRSEGEVTCIEAWPVPEPKSKNLI